MKSKLGGKHSNERVTSDTQNIRRRGKGTVQSDGWSYDFANPTLGRRTISNAANREDAIRQAENLGYSEKDLVRRRRR